MSGMTPFMFETLMMTPRVRTRWGKAPRLARTAESTRATELIDVANGSGRWISVEPTGLEPAFSVTADRLLQV